MGVAHSFASRDGSYHFWRVQSRLVIATMVKAKAMEAKMKEGSGERKRDNPAIVLGKIEWKRSRESRELRKTWADGQNKTSGAMRLRWQRGKCTEQIIRRVA